MHERDRPTVQAKLSDNIVKRPWQGWISSMMWNSFFEWPRYSDYVDWQRARSLARIPFSHIYTQSISDVFFILYRAEKMMWQRRNCERHLLDGDTIDNNNQIYRTTSIVIICLWAPESRVYVQYTLRDRLDIGQHDESAQCAVDVQVNCRMKKADSCSVAFLFERRNIFFYWLIGYMVCVMCVVFDFIGTLKIEWHATCQSMTNDCELWIDQSRPNNKINLCTDMC